MPAALASHLPRHLAIAAGVALLHLGALWALQSGLARRPAEPLVPVALISEVITTLPVPAAAKPQAPTPTAATAPKPLPKAAPLPAAPAPMAAPIATPMATPMATPTPAPTPSAFVGLTTPQAAPAPIGAPVAPVPAAAPAVLPVPAPTPLQLPSSDADYLLNPRPVYPPVSKRLGEQGKVVVRVLIGADGTAQRAEIRQSSGFDRLDHAALNTALKWRYVPGKRGGVPEAMWFNIPISFVLE